ncbi:LEUCINE ZIPPER-EF-HAND CONTAINING TRANSMEMBRANE PROTEIN, partial [Salix viminalis]
MDRSYPLVSADDGVTVNGSPSASTSSDVEEMGLKFNHSLLGDDSTDKLVQSLHDAARIFEVAIKEQDSLSKFSWLSTAWLGVDRNAWVKTLCYEASVYSLLQAAHEISFQGDGRDRDVNIFVQRSLLRQSAPLESLIRDKLSAKQPEAYEWFWSKQVPMVAASFFNYLEEDLSITSGTAVFANGLSSISSNGSDISLLLLALTCNAAITKLGTTKVSCPRFFSMSADISRRLMDMLVDFIPVCQAYHSIKHIGLRREFLVHFGPRVAACRVKNDRGSEEVIFWVNLVQKQLQQAINRERIWSRLTTSESIEILEKDLAIFGFFIAFRKNFIGYLIGGSVLYYPQLSSISSYQLYVEVVCEELDWLPFYPGNDGTTKLSHGHKNKQKGPPNAEAIPQVLDVCSHWMQSFIKYSTWLQNPSNVKAARFLSRG